MRNTIGILGGGVHTYVGAGTYVLEEDHHTTTGWGVTYIGQAQNVNFSPMSAGTSSIKGSDLPPNAGLRGVVEVVGNPTLRATQHYEIMRLKNAQAIVSKIRGTAVNFSVF